MLSVNTGVLANSAVVTSSYYCVRTEYMWVSNTCTFSVFRTLFMFFLMRLSTRKAPQNEMGLMCFECYFVLWRWLISNCFALFTWKFIQSWVSLWLCLIHSLTCVDSAELPCAMWCILHELIDSTLFICLPNSQQYNAQISVFVNIEIFENNMISGARCLCWGWLLGVGEFI